MKLKRFEDDIDNILSMTSNTNVNFKKHDVIYTIPKNKNNWKKLTLSILSIIIIILTTFIIYFYNFSNPKTVFDQYYTSENIIDITRGHGTIDAIRKFQEKDFESSSVMFNDILKKDSTNISVKFYYGLSCIEIGKYDESIKSFQYIIDNNDNLYIDHAKWYLGLCYLKIDQKDKAIEEFKSISLDPDNYHKKDAESILTKLNDN